MPQLAHRLILTGLAGVAATGPAMAGTLDVTVTIPQLRTAEYHRPYVAIWLEQPGQPTIRTLAVWYDFDNRENRGLKWLRDLRSWWRKGGRELTMPADGLTGATRAPGPQRARFNVGALKPGNYVLMVEAAREEGGRELVSVPIAWNGRAATGRGTGSSELGAITATLRP